jgi:hypothetical protein
MLGKKRLSATLRYPNPVGSIPGHPQDKKIGIHAGFACKCALIALLAGGLCNCSHEQYTVYMSQSTTKLGVGKARRIIESVRSLQEEYPHYRTYLTGHSLVSIIRSRWLDNMVGNLLLLGIACANEADVHVMIQGGAL